MSWVPRCPSRRPLSRRVDHLLLVGANRQPEVVVTVILATDDPDDVALAYIATPNPPAEPTGLLRISLEGLGILLAPHGHECDVDAHYRRKPLRSNQLSDRDRVARCKIGRLAQDPIGGWIGRPARLPDHGLTCDIIKHPKSLGEVGYALHTTLVGPA